MSFYIKTCIVRLGRQNRAYPEELPVQGILCLFMEYDISDPTQVDLTSNFYVLCTMCFASENIVNNNSGWSLG